MTAEFVHLHVHSEFTMLDGSIRIPKMVEKVGEMGMPAIALTDRGNMFGAVQLYEACAGTDVKPIFGAEVQITDDRHDANIKRPSHVILLAGSQEGYQNLVRLVSLGWVEGLHHGIPRIDFDTLREHNKDLVGLSACLGGYLPQQILMRGVEAGRDAMAKLRDSFEPKSFYAELEDHGFPENRPLNQIIVELANDLEVPLVATNCCHFMERDAAKAQMILGGIKSGQSIREVEAMHHNSAEMYLKTPDQMAELFKDLPEAIQNTMAISERCAGVVNPLHKPKLPRFSVPGTQSEADYLREISREGLQTRLRELDALHQTYNEEEYAARLELELDVINNMGFPGYFLIVQDFIIWAKEHDVPVGPGRGSGAGSIVAWSLRITDLDPIPYGLLFERFLNPERVSMPDFDIDFCMDKRELVINYVREKYGHQSVGQIATFHQLKSRSVVRDVGRVMGFAPADSARIASLIPEPVGGKPPSIKEALELEPRLKQVYEHEHGVGELIDTAQELENLTRHAGMHAAGVVISEGPIWDHVPVFCPDDDVYVTQYHKDDVEAAGLVKFDFLGLRTLTVLDIAVKLINKRPDRESKFRLEAIPLTDLATYALLQSGETTNVFQLESTGMQGLFKQLKPDCFEDIVAAVALYRPGPMGAGMHTDFVLRKHGKQKVTYPDPSLEDVLRDTRGVIVYQEQVMQIARSMGGYSLGGADLLRRAMGKKKKKEMDKQKLIFVAGAEKNGHSKEKAVEVFDLMAFFAGYGFNKSHSAAYALITYQTAYLKAHFPVEFCCATLSADKDKTDKVVRTVAEARSMGITVLPPDVNESEVDFTVVYAPDEAVIDGQPITRPKNKPLSSRGTLRDPMGPKIRFGLGAIKGVGGGALDSVFEERNGEEGEQPFIDLFDFCGRVDPRRVNKSVATALVACGAFDTVHAAGGITRAQATEAVEAAIARGKRMAQERASGQTNLFGLLGDPDADQKVSIAAGAFPNVPPWDSTVLLQKEKASLGFYVSGHPLDRYASELRRVCNATTETLQQLDKFYRVQIGGSVEGYRERRTKTGNTMAFFALEDPLGRAEVIIRPKQLEDDRVRDILRSGEAVIVIGKVKHERDRMAGDDAEPEAKIVLDDVKLLSDALKARTRRVEVKLAMTDLHDGSLRGLRQALESHPGPCPVTLELRETGAFAATFNDIGMSVDPTDALMASLERLFGGKVCELR